jgi:predicted NBD/HSP70 family sugar kinase
VLPIPCGPACEGRGDVPIKAHKQNNIRRILALIRQHDAFSVAEIAGAVRLSKTIVKKTIDLLDAMKLVLSAGKGLSTEDGGRKPGLYRFNRNFGFVISIHITPDSIIAVMTDLAADISYYKKQEVAGERGLDLVLGQLVGLIHGFVAMKASTSEKLIAIVIALPGLADSSRGVSIYSPHYPSWGRNVPFTQLLRDCLGDGYDVPMFIDCVNRYQAIAEREKGVAKGVANFIIIDALNEGLGAGIIIHGELVRGSQSLSGEIGHMTLNPVDGPMCICGNRGCFEAMVSARRLRDLIREARQLGVSSALFSDGSPEDLSIEQVCDMATKGDAFCMSLIDDVARWFVVGLGNVIMVNDPELIVIQGLYLTAGSSFLDRIRNGIKHVGLPDVEKQVRIEYSTLGEERGVIGGAVFAITDFYANRLVFRIP